MYDCPHNVSIRIPHETLGTKPYWKYKQVTVNISRLETQIIYAQCSSYKF